jgi:lysophosphatidylcholine acyltransferase/lyso-PAF acetyltransferase
MAYAQSVLFVSRTDKNDKEKVLRQIEERQKQAEKSEMPPLGIFPEASTTNNKSIVQFKRGAFKYMKSVLPVGLVYNSRYLNPANDILAYLPHMTLMACQLYNEVQMYEMPIFRPNQFFIDKCEKEGKKPEVEF